MFRRKGLSVNNAGTRTIQAVTPATLARVFDQLPGHIVCVVLSACYTQLQAAGIARVIPTVVGMSREVSDTAAIAFAAGFYEGLAFGQSIKKSFELGCVQVELCGQSTEATIPHLTEKEGVEAARLHLVSGLSSTPAPAGVFPARTQSNSKLSRLSRLNKIIKPTAASIALGTVAIVGYNVWEWHKRHELSECKSLESDEHSCEHGSKSSCRRLFECHSLLCREGNLSACSRLCLFYETGKGTKINFSSALACYENTCEKGSADGCLQTANILRNGSSGFRNERRAYYIYTKLCDNNDSAACNNLANIYHESTGAVQDLKRAEELYQKSCSMGNSTACTNLKIVQAFKPNNIDKKTAFNNLERDCEKDSAAACNSIGVQQIKGIETLPDSRKSREHFEKSCHLNYALGCFNLGKILEASQQDPLPFYRKGCELGNLKSCYRLASLLTLGKYSRKDEPEALEIFKKACQQDEARSCFRIGWLLEYGKGGEARNITTAVQAYAKSCKNGYKLACERSSALQISEKAEQHTDHSPITHRDMNAQMDTFSTSGHPSDTPDGGYYELLESTEEPASPGYSDYAEGGDPADPGGGRCGNSTKQSEFLEKNFHYQSVIYPNEGVDILLLSSAPKGDVSLDIRGEMFEAQALYKIVNFDTSTGLKKLFNVVKRLRPRIVHFSGHGNSLSPLWVDENNDAQFLSHLTWKLLAKFLADHGTECIFFNTCYSDEISHSLTGQIDKIVGITGEITNRAAIELSNGFYTALRNGGSFQNSLDFARRRSVRAQPNVSIRLFEKK